jgi:hypothetical protein
MAQTSYPTLKTHFNISGGSEAISNETIPIPSSTPYQIALAQIPQGKTGVTAIADNEYDGVSIGSVLTVEVNDGTDAAPSWTARTPTDSSSPTSAQVYVHLADEVWSSQLAFNVADAGKNCRVTYTGWGSPLLIEHINRLVDHVGRLEAWLPLSMHSEGSYNRAWFSPESSELGNNSERVYVCQAGCTLAFISDDLTWNGGWADFDTGGNCEIAAFTNADYWRKIYLYLYDNSGTLTLDTVEGTEAATKGAATEPDAPTLEHIKIGIIAVQNDGTTATVGRILAIPQADITSELALLHSTGSPVTRFVDRDTADYEQEYIKQALTTEGTDYYDTDESGSPCWKASSAKIPFSVATGLEVNTNKDVIYAVEYLDNLAAGYVRLQSNTNGALAGVTLDTYANSGEWKIVYYADTQGRFNNDVAPGDFQIFSADAEDNTADQVITIRRVAILRCDLRVLASWRVDASVLPFHKEEVVFKLGERGAWPSGASALYDAIRLEFPFYALESSIFAIVSAQDNSATTGNTSYNLSQHTAPSAAGSDLYAANQTMVYTAYEDTGNLCDQNQLIDIGDYLRLDLEGSPTGGEVERAWVNVKGITIR